MAKHKETPAEHIHGPGCDHDHAHDDGDNLAPYRREAPKPGRNEPCFCGSGKKYKKCHGAANAA